MQGRVTGPRQLTISLERAFWSSWGRLVGSIWYALPAHKHLLLGMRVRVGVGERVDLRYPVLFACRWPCLWNQCHSMLWCLHHDTCDIRAGNAGMMHLHSCPSNTFNILKARLVQQCTESILQPFMLLWIKEWSRPDASDRYVYHAFAKNRRVYNWLVRSAHKSTCRHMPFGTYGLAWTYLLRYCWFSKAKSTAAAQVPPTSTTNDFKQLQTQ